MANNRCTYQQQHTVSIPKVELIDNVATNPNLGKKDLRVFLLLATQLNGWKEGSRRGTTIDPKNFVKIDTEQIADVLDMDTRDVKKSIKKLRDEYIIEKGDTDATLNGYRFTF